jgi:hypothetical protein
MDLNLFENDIFGQNFNIKFNKIIKNKNFKNIQRILKECFPKRIIKVVIK